MSRKKFKRLIKQVEKAHARAEVLTEGTHPGMRANALRHLASAADDLRWLRANHE